LESPAQKISRLSGEMKSGRKAFSGRKESFHESGIAGGKKDAFIS
jgi:hypothetical protein